jgi:cytochrome c oxidase cbb3-type subunit I/II
MSTFEGPMMSLKNVNAISHFTDWTIAHVHIGGLGWNGFMTFGILYYLIPKLWNTKMYSDKLSDFHFWIGTLGIILYALPMYWAGFTQSLMWKEFTAEGFLAYPNFLETVTQLKPMYAARAFGGGIYIIGVIAMLYNLIMTMKQGTFQPEEEASAAPLTNDYTAHKGEGWHRAIERRPIQMLVFSLVAVAIGGAIEIIPTMLIDSNIPTIASVKPYTPLELEGRDIYIREGCYNCHSQMIRPFRSETERYGEYSKAGEFVYDHPFQWGSKRTGPDLHRIGAKYSDSWHYNHMWDPASMSPGTIMPSYPWLFDSELSTDLTAGKIRAMQTLGVPYEEGYDQLAVEDLNAQAQQIADNLKKDGIEVLPQTEIVALIAYLQRLGTDIKVKDAQAAMVNQ